MSKQQKWDQAYNDADFSSASPSQVLAENVHLLPDLATSSAGALDLACGRAGNAQFLAKKNFNVDAIDISPVLINQLKTYVKEKELNINCIQKDIESEGLEDKQYDVIVVSYFLNRDLFPLIIDALKPDGLLFYQTWSQLTVNDNGPKNAAFRLEANELLDLCSRLHVIHYREDGLQGDHSKGLRNEAMLIAKNSYKG